MSALRQTLAEPMLSPAELQFLRTVANDTEDAPWMVMNDRQFWGASGLAWSLDTYARFRRLPWYVGGMLPLTYLPQGETHLKQVAPDVFVAFIAARQRDSLNIEEEGMPPFVLEVVSGSSVKRDLEEKPELYRLLGTQEYAIVRLDLAEPRLEGFRSDENGAWRSWTPDDEGRLWSEVLQLRLVLREGEVRAVTPDGEVLRTLHEAEDEVVRLRAALDRLTRGDESSR